VVLSESGLEEVRPQGRLQRLLGHRSFPQRLPLLELDRVFVRGLQVVASGVHNPAGYKGLSDHVPMVVDLQW
ncbi:MAG: EEP domain-containing protein, partial [Limnobacter sp.]|nr:EEP domain-containing protein [Limnobacter sp.]